MQLIIVVLCSVFIFVSSESSEESKQCPQFHSQAGVTLSNLTGSPLYFKYSKAFHDFNDLDSAVFTFTKEEGADNKYTVKHVTIDDEGKKKETVFHWTEFPSKQEVVGSRGNAISFAIPYLEKDKVAVVYMCDAEETIEDEPVTVVMVFTTSLDNDLTKAVEEGKKLTGGQDLHEIPFKHKNLITV